LEQKKGSLREPPLIRSHVTSRGNAFWDCMAEHGARIPLKYLKTYSLGDVLGMRAEEAKAKVKLRHGDQAVELDALVDTGASMSLMSKRLSDKLGCFHPIKPYELRTADKEGELRINGYCRADIEFQGYEIPGGAVLEVVENLREDLDLVVGRPEIDKWDVIFTPEGPKLRRYPPVFEII